MALAASDLRQVVLPIYLSAPTLPFIILKSSARHKSNKHSHFYSYLINLDCICTGSKNCWPLAHWKNWTHAVFHIPFYQPLCRHVQWNHLSIECEHWNHQKGKLEDWIGFLNPGYHFQFDQTRHQNKIVIYHTVYKMHQECSAWFCQI